MSVLRSPRFSYQFARFVTNESSAMSLHTFSRCVIFPRLTEVPNFCHGSDSFLFKPSFFFGKSIILSSSLHTSNKMQHIEVLQNLNIHSEICLPTIVSLSSAYSFNSQLQPIKPTNRIKRESNNALSTSTQPDKSPEPRKPKKSLWARVKAELVHYYHGFRLLGLETKIAGGICFQVLTGKTLSRRERNQLVRTSADIFRLVPFAVFIIVPFMEFLLPVYLKFFPFMLPSTFKEKGKEEEKMRQVLKAKLEMAKFLQETIMKTTSLAAQGKDVPTIMEFQDFLKTVRKSGQLASTTDIVRFSRLFEDQVTLDCLEHDQLKALCQLLEISAIGPSKLLRFHLWLRVRQLRAEDQLIAKEGVQQIPPWELQSLSRDRGMRSLGLTEDRLRSQLNQWLELHLEKNIPISLLLLSRALYLQDTTLPAEQQLQQVLSKLPEAAAEEAVVKVVESTDAVDPKTKIEILRKEQASIKAEKKAEKQRKSEEEKAESAAIHPPEPLLVDKAELLKQMAGEQLVDSAKILREAQAAIAIKSEFKIPEPTVLPQATTTTTPSPIVEPATTSTTSTIDAVLDEIISETIAMKEATTVEPIITAKDLDNIATAIGNLEDSKKAMQDEQLHELKAAVKETEKLRKVQQEQETKAKEEVADLAEKVALETSQAKDQIAAAAKAPKVAATAEDITIDPLMVEQSPADLLAEAKQKAKETKAKLAEKAKAEKAARRIGSQVDRLLQDLNVLTEKLGEEKTSLLEGIHVQEAKVKETTVDSEKEKIFDSIRADQERVVDISDIIVSLQSQPLEEVKDGKSKSAKFPTEQKSLQQLALTPEETSERWQRILDALDEDHDGKIELKHVLAVVKLMNSEKIELNTKQISEVMEMLEQEQLVEEKTAAEDKTAATASSEPEPKKL